eukprot:2618438-Rhodomonas_salina.2
MISVDSDSEWRSRSRWDAPAEPEQPEQPAAVSSLPGAAVPVAPPPEFRSLSHTAASIIRPELRLGTESTG